MQDLFHPMFLCRFPLVLDYPTGHAGPKNFPPVGDESAEYPIKLTLLLGRYRTIDSSMGQIALALPEVGIEHLCLA